MNVEAVEKQPQEKPWNEELNVTEEEACWAMRKVAQKKAAPGPDGIHRKILMMAYKVFGGKIRALYSRCLRERWFPNEWRKSNLILLHKEGMPEHLPSAYKPICLLDEMSKTLERIISKRITQHLTETGPDIHRFQFGFRLGISTNDAILYVKRFVREEQKEGRVVLAVSLDITNASNTARTVQKTALKHHEIPGYLRSIIGSCLSDRWLNFRDREDTRCERNVQRGVPQGSVLGPLLWNLGYNKVLTGVALPLNCVTVCYADDTVILAAGKDWAEARSRADDAGVVGMIRSLGLEVAPQKTEAVCFHDGSHDVPPPMGVNVEALM